MTSEPSAPAGPRPVPDPGPPQTRRQRRELEAARARKAKAGRNLPAAITVGALLLGGALVGLIWLPVVLAILVVALLLLGVTETASAISRRGLDVPRIPLWTGAVAMPLGAFAGGAEALVLALLGTVLLILVWAVAEDLPARGESVLVSVFIVMWVPFLLSFAVALLRQEQGNLMVACMLLMVVANDTFGYIVGASFGRHPMAPKVSPKKSWEGFAGSVGGSVVVGTLAVHFLLDHPWWIGSLLGLLTVASATAGDFAESMVKRELNIKDMGSMLPGHGGAMDRLDSLVFSAPVAYMVFALPFV
ncbi:MULTISPECIES: phosphatidate cytidylyltransferase [Micrococcaceae]|uniref:phosphatidate cytidylyltransferase n=1 Tax=Micrococcaceae TaxID=1268 RepID=UPI001616B06D|nr:MULTISPECIES: phosphatidate cytidylyltransferase [Micrococcaceae]MBB5748222.1 phosphatidate cytidylyltransferase [Micrococcus sp. TA1]HRO30644.1 phosphatidate cytidylyltransferase [Citricoccus sp.]HRO94933.1 phosphatidate cytidylyltransferase [Citricoccus sp.]